jgi:hypothetical protein
LPLVFKVHVDVGSFEEMMRYRGGRRDRKSLAFWLLIATVLLQVTPMGLSGMSTEGFWSLDNKPSPDPGSMRYVAIFHFAQWFWLAISGIIWISGGYDLFYFLSVGLCGTCTLGAGVFALFLASTYIANSICGEDTTYGQVCDNATKKILATGVIEVVLG